MGDRPGAAASKATNRHSIGGPVAFRPSALSADPPIPGRVPIKRVLFVTDVDLSGTSGQNVATREFVNALARRDDVKLTVICPRSEDQSLAALWEIIDVTRFLPAKRRQSVIWGLMAQGSLFRHLSTALRREPIDLIVARRGPSLFLPALFSRVFKVRYVLLQRGMRPPGQRSWKERILRIPLRMTSRFDIRTADQIFAAYEEVKQSIDRDRLHGQPGAIILPNAVDPEKFRPVSTGSARSRLAHLGLTADDVIVGFVGSFQERHAVHVLIQAVAKVKSRHPNTKLLAVGDGPLRDELVDLAARLEIADAVILPGAVPHEDVSLYTSASDLLAAVVDTRWPSNPIKVYEYLASGRPVVTSERPELRFIREHSLGRLVQGNEDHMFAHALLELLALPQDARERMGEAGRAYVERHHTWRQFSDAVLRP